MNIKYLTKIFITSLAIFSIGCSILNTSIESQTAYLNEILEAHQTSIDKQNERAANKKYGYKSKEHIMAERKKAAINKENVHKIEQFLQRFGHPSEKLHGSELTDLPFIIFSASSKSKKIIKRNLSYIHIAWQQQVISDRTYIYYLQSLHTSKFKQKLKLNSPYTEKEEIDSLATKLKIDSLLSVY